jgi:hypothetical protein
MKKIIESLNDVSTYNTETQSFDRLRVKAGMTPTVFCPLSSALLHLELPDHEADIIAQSFYDYSVMVNAGNDVAKFEASIASVISSTRENASKNWLNGLKANPAQIWKDGFTLPDTKTLLKGVMTEAKDIIYTETFKGLAANGPAKAMVLAGLVQQLITAIAEDRNKKKAKIETPVVNPAQPNLPITESIPQS